MAIFYNPNKKKGLFYAPSGATGSGGGGVLSIEYSASAFCEDGIDPTPTVSNNVGAGTFSSTMGLVFISTTTGEVDLSASTSGATYVITYTDTNSATATFSLTVNALDDASFAYSASSYSQSDADPTPTVTGLSGGTFSAGSGLVFVDSGTNTGSSTGEIDLSASTVASYTITYDTTSSGSSVCPNTSTQTVEIAVAGIANNYSMNFDSASSDYISIGTSDLVSGVFSISMWIKRETNGQMCLINKDDVGLNRTFNAYFNTSGALNFFMSNTGAFLSNKRTITSNTITDTNWHHLVFINNGDTTNSQIFIDGTEATYSTHNTGISNLHSSSVENKIGTQGSGQYYFDGLIDELAIWNTALTDGTGGTVNQIAEIYNGTSTNLTKDLTTVSGSNLIYWNRMGD